MKQKTTLSLVLSIIMSLITIAFINTVMLWQPYTSGVILPIWKDILWAMNLAAAINLAGYIILLCTRPARVYVIVQTAQMAASLLNIVVFLMYFPFHFGAVNLGWLDTLCKVLIWIGLAGSVIGIIVNIARLAGNVQYEEKK